MFVTSWGLVSLTDYGQWCCDGSLLPVETEEMDVCDGNDEPRQFAAKLDLFLSQIPTETSLSERRLLYRLFREQWDGRGAVVELGPFLGGTTRAIAWGMWFNARRQAGASLETFDRFGDYHSEESLRSIVEPLVKANLLNVERADELCRGGSFETLFHEIHRPFEYAELLKVHTAALPDFPETIADSKALDPVLGRPIGGVFVDGCKSWASTYYAMRQLLPAMDSGGLVIFQDFGWYTCFWISAIVYSLRQFLRFQECADATYVFELVRPPSQAEVESRCAIRPEDSGASYFREVANYFQHEARERDDLRGELIAHLHEIAALATIGEKAAAVEILKNLEVERFTPFLSMIEACVKSPTYLPGGKRVVWQ